MKPTTARIIITATVFAVVILGVGIVNSSFHGSFVVGLFIIVLPFLVLSYSLPLVLPVKCMKCGGRMHFHFTPQRVEHENKAEKEMYGYVCERCSTAHLWESASSESTLD